MVTTDRANRLRAARLAGLALIQLMLAHGCAPVHHGWTFLVLPSLTGSFAQVRNLMTNGKRQACTMAQGSQRSVMLTGARPEPALAWLLSLAAFHRSGRRGSSSCAGRGLPAARRRPAN